MKKMKVKITILFLCLTSFLFSESAIDFYKKAKDAFYQEQYNEAIYNYKEALVLNPHYAEALLDLSKLYYEIGNYDYASSYIANAMKLFPKNDELTIFSADIDTKLKRYELAEKKYRGILAKNPLNIDAYRGLANLYLNTDRRVQAKNVLDEMLKAEPNNFNALAMMANYYENVPDKIRAEKYYIANIEANSTNPEVFFNYSIFNFNNGNMPRAIDNIKLAISIKDIPKYQKFYGKYLLFINKGDDALKVFKKLSLNSEVDYLTYYHLGYSYYLLSDYDNAKYSFNKALALRDDDETTGFFLNQLLINYFPVNDPDKIKRSNYYYDKAQKSKKESELDIYIFSLKEAIRVYPKNVPARVELAEHFLSQKLPERYIRELKIATMYSDDIKIKDRLEVEQKRVNNKLGDSWNISQYSIKEDRFSIPLFVKQEITNPHFAFEKVYARLLSTVAYDSPKYEIVLFDDTGYSDDEKLEIAKNNNSPFYLLLHAKEDSINVNVILNLINSTNNQTIGSYDAFRYGNDRLFITSNTLIQKFSVNIPFVAHVVKISNNRAIINAGRRSGLALKDKFIIVQKKNYPIEIDRAKFLINSNDIKAKAIVVKLDENIAEIEIKENSFFKSVDIDDLVLF